MNFGTPKNLSSRTITIFGVIELCLGEMEPDLGDWAQGREEELDSAQDTQFRDS